MQHDFMFTSESVTEGHPDKLCDQVSDAIVDRFLQQDPYARIIAECATSTAILFIAARFDAKAPIVSAGDPGEAFYVILSGRATIRRGRGRATTEIGPGTYFGEMALVDDAPRSATVLAETETVCLMLARKRFTKMLEKDPAVALALLRTLATRVRELEASATV